MVERWQSNCAGEEHLFRFREQMQTGNGERCL